MDRTKEILDFDPINEAEKITKKSWQEDDFTKALGLYTHIQHNKLKKEYLKNINDSYWGIPVITYIGLIEHNGFQEVFKEEFFSKSSGELEVLYVFFHSDGILLKFDTYSGQTSISGGQFYYNIKPFDITEFLKNGCTSSGQFKDDIWAGYHDCREGVIYNIDKLRKNGEFINPWKYSPSLYWISHHGDSDDNKNFYERKEVYSACTKKRIEKFPKNVQDCIIINY